MILFRPVGEAELRLIAETNFRTFPPRLDWQPIFYPVLNQRYAKRSRTDGTPRIPRRAIGAT